MIVKTTRAVAKAVGSVLDEEDRTVLGRVAVLLLGTVAFIVALAFAAGLAIRAFEFAAG